MWYNRCGIYIFSIVLRNVLKMLTTHQCNWGKQNAEKEISWGELSCCLSRVTLLAPPTIKLQTNRLAQNPGRMRSWSARDRTNTETIMLWQYCSVYRFNTHFVIITPIKDRIQGWSSSKWRLAFLEALLYLFVSFVFTSEPYILRIFY